MNASQLAARPASEQGYARVAAGPGFKARLKGARWGIGAFLLLVLVGFVLVAGTSQEDFTPLSTRNTGEDGTRALAQVLREQGLDVRQAEALDQARITDPNNTTLVIADASTLLDFQVESILEYPGDITVIGISDEFLRGLDSGASVSYSSAQATYVGCDDPDAEAAGALDTAGTTITGEISGQVEKCFPTVGGAGYVVVELDGRTIRIIADPAVVTNGSIVKAGNAALALRATGHHNKVVWVLTSFLDSSVLTWSDGTGPEGGSPDIQSNPDFMPPGLGNGLYALGVALIAAALWRGRRFGALVVEQLPVIIRASESTRGRARLYRKARATGRATAAIRANAARRMGSRLGVSKVGTKDELVAAIVRASGKSRADVEALLYGPAPTTERAMMDLVERIDTLEKEVHHP